MSDQPKPATGWCTPDMRCNLDGCPICGAIKSNAPKPTTGEWTAAKVRELRENAPFHHSTSEMDADITIADAHNAAIKEAYQKGYDDGNQARSSG